METRPLSLQERQALARDLRESAGLKDRLFAASLAGFVSLGIGLLIAESVFSGTLASQSIPVVLALIVGVLVYRRMRVEEWRTKQADDLTAELAGGLAEVVHYSARNAIRVDEFEDEGLSFFLELTGGGVLFLSGQYLYEADEEGQFPNTTFSIVRTPRTRRVLEFECEGSYFAPIETRAPFTNGEYERGLPSDGDILDLDFHSLLKSEAR